METKQYYDLNRRADEAKKHIGVSTYAQNYHMADLYHANADGEMVYGVPGVAVPAVPPTEAVYPTKSGEGVVDLVVKFWGGSLRYVKGTGPRSPGEWLYRAANGAWVVNDGDKLGDLLTFVYAATYATIEREILGVWEATYKSEIDAGKTELQAWHTSLAKLRAQCDGWTSEYIHMVLKPSCGRLGRTMRALSRHHEIVTDRAAWSFPKRHEVQFGAPRVAICAGQATQSHI